MHHRTERISLFGVDTDSIHEPAQFLVVVKFQQQIPKSIFRKSGFGQQSLR